MLMMTHLRSKHVGMYFSPLKTIKYEAKRLQKCGEYPEMFKVNLSLPRSSNCNIRFVVISPLGKVY